MRERWKAFAPLVCLVLVASAPALAFAIQGPVLPANDLEALLGLGQTALQQMVSRTALNNETQKLGLTVSDAAVAGNVRAMAPFRGTLGQFDRRVFVQALAVILLPYARNVDAHGANVVRGARSSGSGMNSGSPGTEAKLPLFQSCEASSISSRCSAWRRPRTRDGRGTPSRWRPTCSRGRRSRRSSAWAGLPGPSAG